MRRVWILFGFFLLLLFLSPAALAETQWSLGVSIGDEGIRNFNLSIGQYYRVPEREVVVVRKKGFRDEELPVVFFLASRARVAPGVIVDLRSRGLSWMDITFHFGLTPEIYYVPVKEVKVGPPYGKAYGHYKKPKHEWKKIHLVDDDVVNLVNLRFISEHHGYAPETVMRMRAEGKNFVAIHDAAYRDRHANVKERNDHHDNEMEGKKGRGKGKKW